MLSPDFGFSELWGICEHLQSNETVPIAREQQAPAAAEGAGGQKPSAVTQPRSSPMATNQGEQARPKDSSSVQPWVQIIPQIHSDEAGPTGQSTSQGRDQVSWEYGPVIAGQLRSSETDTRSSWEVSPEVKISGVRGRYSCGWAVLLQSLGQDGR